MEALKIIGWFVWISVSMCIVFEFIGWSGLTKMFPEGQRWYHPFLQYGSLVFFAWAVLSHPFG